MGARQAPDRALQGVLHAGTEITECPRSLLLGDLGPLFQPATLGLVTIERGKAGRVDHEPQHHEVGVDLAGKHRLQVELKE